MKRSDLREAASYNTGKASDVARQLAYAGIAVVWIFKSEEQGTPIVPHELIVALVFLGATLAADLAQYVLCGMVWGIFNRYKEVKRLHRGEDESFDAPVWINAPGLFCYWSKIGAVSVGYFWMLRFLLIEWRIA